jgi:tRNA threonylcarbamoyladenosine biosynthesis protein TsaB
LHRTPTACKEARTTVSIGERFGFCARSVDYAVWLARENRYDYANSIEIVTGKTPNNNAIILAVDTSQPTLYLAVTRGADLLVDVTDTSGLPHSQRLFPLLQESLAKLALAPDQLDLFAVNTGPGSFTGLRVGIAAVKGLAATLGKPLLGINALDATALAAGRRAEPIIVLLNASRGEVFCGVRDFVGNLSVRTLGTDLVGKLELILPPLQEEFGITKAVFLGSGAAAHWLSIAALNPLWGLGSSPESLAPTIARLAYEQWLSGQTPAANPYYIRPSEAELKLAK